MVVTTGNLLFTMLKEECMTDVTFIVEGSEIRGHRNVAACRGGRLKRMLQGEKKRVEVNGITPQTFSTVLEYLYTTDVEVTDTNVFHLMHAAQELELVCLQSECVQFLQNILTTENFSAHATEAVDAGIPEYIKVIQNYFGQLSSELLKEEAGILGCPQEVLRVLCGSEEINCSELELFLCCMEWAKQKCRKKEMEENPENLRQILGDTLDNIRFSTMDNSDFERIVIPLQILSFEEIGQIVMKKGTEEVRGPQHEEESAESEEANETNATSNEYMHLFFESHTSEFLKSDKFENLSLDELVTLYSAESIECLELDLFTAAMKWYTINNPRKEDFLEVLDNIRFPTIPMQDFIKYVVPISILTYKQVGQVIFQMQTKQESSAYCDEGREIWVHIEAYTWDRNNKWKETRLQTTRATTIGQLKALPIFNGGKSRCDPESFTLGKKETKQKLDDNVTLDSLIRPTQSANRKLELYFHSCSYVINCSERSFTCVSGSTWHSVVSKWVRGNHGLFKRISIDSGTLMHPGCEITITT